MKSKMYGIKPLLSKKEMTVELPTIMYKMENIYKKFAGKVNVDEHQNDIIQRINQISKVFLKVTIKYWEKKTLD